MGCSYRFKNLAGMQVGFWKVISIAGRSKHGNAMWKCVCTACGSEHVLFSHNIIRGRSRSCKNCRTYHRQYLSARMRAANQLLSALTQSQSQSDSR
jgi:hypothetical protein